MPSARHMAAVACAAMAVICAAASTVPAAGDRSDLHTALADLRAGRFQDAEQAALALATRETSPLPRAWLVVATARQRQRRFDDALEAFRQYLSCCDSTHLRQYVLEQMDACRTDAQPPAATASPSSRLSPAELRNLSGIDWVTYTETTAHFTVRSRNAALSKLVAAEAEDALTRICRDLLGGQEYPHSVSIYVWPNRDEYLANSPGNAPEWSDGSFTISYSGDLPTRRIDLTQLDAQRRFAAVMIDRILPHEMCHLVVKEYFGDSPCPLAVNEGLAMLAESHIDNERIILAGKALSSKAKIPLETLLAAELSDMPSKEVFYAECFSFMEYVHSRLTVRQFKAFLDHVKSGCEVAEAIQRALAVPGEESLLPALAAAWEEQAVADGQILEALSVEQASTSGPLDAGPATLQAKSR